MPDARHPLHETIAPDASAMWGPAERFPLSGSARRPLHLPDGDATLPFGPCHLTPAAVTSPGRDDPIRSRRATWCWETTTEDMRMAATLTSHGWADGLSHGDHQIPLERICSVSYRRPGRCDLSNHRPGAVRRFAEAEARQGFGGILASLDCAWIDHPARVADAEYKPYRLKIAAESGLRIPRSHLTNDPASARAFADSVAGTVVSKPLSTYRFGVEHGRSFVLLTSPVDRRDLSWARVEGSDAGPVVVQGGPQRLRERLEEADALRVGSGRASFARYGLSIDAEGWQRLWLDSPEGQGWDL
jgi:hypothetical protein